MLGIIIKRKPSGQDWMEKSMHDAARQQENVTAGSCSPSSREGIKTRKHLVIVIAVLIFTVVVYQWAHAPIDLFFGGKQ